MIKNPKLNKKQILNKFKLIYINLIMLRFFKM